MRKWVLIIGLVVLAVLGGVAGGGYLGFRYTLQKSLPRVSGMIPVRGVEEVVEIIRDTYGVPHIYAKTESDLYFGFGYAMAQDRFWQMEFYRRLGQGQLSEVFGRDSVTADRYFRMLTAAGVKRDIPEGLSRLFTAFAEGVNAYLETHRDRLPIEFRLLGYRPEPWGTDDYLAILRFLSWSLSSGWRVDLTAAQILKRVGEERLREAFPVWPEDSPIIIPREIKTLSGSLGPFAETILPAGSYSELGAVGGSNNWALTGKRSVTGKPLLANDPHLPLTNPSIWWEVHLVCPTIDVSGLAVAGLPAIISGHNRQVAWGVTNVEADDVDFYVEKINPDNPRQYWYRDHWEEMRVTEETIKVKGGVAIKAQVLLTHHGPILVDQEAVSEGKVLSARWSFADVPQSAKATYLLLKAENVNDVCDALRYWTAPGLNFVFADTRENIGYWCCAAIPIRPGGDGMLPVPGWTGEYEWTGYVPFEEMPHVINPDSGFVATANNKVAADDYPYFISHYWEPMDRITRIREMITAQERFSVEDLRQMQQDVYSVLATEITPRMIEILEKRLSGIEAQKARGILSTWDFRMARDSVAASLFEVTYHRMIKNTFKDELGEELFEAYLKTACFPPRAIRAMTWKGSSPWFDDVATREREDMEDIVERSLRQTLADLTEAMGKDMDKWTWGHLHTLTFEHVLGRKKPLHRIFNLGPYPLGGSRLTVNKGQYPYERPYALSAGASHRIIIDLSDMNRCLRVLPTGESGHRGSRHHKDQVPLYLSGRYHPDWTDRSEVERHSEAVPILKPELWTPIPPGNRCGSNRSNAVYFFRASDDGAKRACLRSHENLTGFC